MNSTPAHLESSTDPKLLVRPITKGSAGIGRGEAGVNLALAKLAYPIHDGIPIMLPEEARKID